jgi:cardiolipin synthase
MVEGPVVKELLDTFKRSWTTWRGKRIFLNETGEEKTVKEPNAGIPALPIFVYSRKGRKRMRSLLRYSVENAKTEVLLTTAYITPSRRMIAVLAGAVKRGAKVRLLVPGKSDIPAASYAGRAFFTKLLKSGVDIYTYRGEMLHAKTYLFDQCWSIVGSTNLDYQSLMYNDEGNIGILDPPFAESLRSIFEEDLKKSAHISLEGWSRRSFLEKIKEHFFALFRKRL